MEDQVVILVGSVVLALIGSVQLYQNSVTKNSEKNSLLTKEIYKEKTENLKLLTKLNSLITKHKDLKIKYKKLYFSYKKLYRSYNKLKVVYDKAKKDEKNGQKRKNTNS